MIVCVNGVVFGGGVGLIVCCDIVIGVEGVKFGFIEVKFGLVLVVILFYVIIVIGLCQVCWLFFIGEFFDVVVVVCIGLLYEVVLCEQLDEVVQCVFGFFGKVGLVVQVEVKMLVLGMVVLDEVGVEWIDEENVVLIVWLCVLVEGQEGLGVFLGKCVVVWVVQLFVLY